MNPPRAVLCQCGVKRKILVVDDEPEAVELVRFTLEQEGYEVETAGDGMEGLRKAETTQPELIVLDVIMPQMDGMEVCRLLRSDAVSRRIPIIMLTARASEADRVLGLELGADDYMVKPFSTRELLVRIRKQLERGRSMLVFGDLVIDPWGRVVTWKGAEISFTPTEVRLLCMLATRPGRVLSREELQQQVKSGDVPIGSRTVDMHMFRIREKLGEAGSYLETVRGVGYRFVERSR